jgi:hypothetical protein
MTYFAVASLSMTKKKRFITFIPVRRSGQDNRKTCGRRSSLLPGIPSIDSGR